MNTTINNNQRVFQAITSTGKQAFCNIEQLNEVVAAQPNRKAYEHRNRRSCLFSF